MSKRIYWPLAPALLLVAACGSDPATPEAPASANEGLIKTERGWLFRTPTLSVAPGEERYVCHTLRATQDMEIHRFASGAARAVHHFQLNEALAPKQDGVYACENFPTDWSPLYTATTVAAELKTPPGSARYIAKGAQLVLQTHLLNLTAEPIDTALEIEMEETTEKGLEPVGILGFGSANILLAPKQTTTVENVCHIDLDVRAYMIVPHMHFLGRRMQLELGPDEDHMEVVYEREPFDFNDQHFDPFERTIPAGSIARVRCTYENDGERVVHYGESSHDEMCNLAAFVVGHDGVGFCTQEPQDPSRRVPRAKDAGLCGFSSSPSGIGKLCGRGEGECGDDLYCSADVLRVPSGICLQIGCNSNDDCDGTVCCTQPGVGSIANVCIPEACRPEECIPVGTR